MKPTTPYPHIPLKRHTGKSKFAISRAAKNASRAAVERGNRFLAPLPISKAAK
jgi:hypothetical protein